MGADTTKRGVVGAPMDAVPVRDPEPPDVRLQAWRPLPAGDIATIRARVAGRYAGCVVRVVARHDELLSGLSRYTVECVRYPFGAGVETPYGGADPAGQHEGSRLDVSRFELLRPSRLALGLVRQFDRRHRDADAEQRAADRLMDAAEWVRAVARGVEVVHG